MKDNVKATVINDTDIGSDMLVVDVVAPLFASTVGFNRKSRRETKCFLMVDNTWSETCIPGFRVPLVVDAEIPIPRDYASWQCLGGENRIRLNGGVAVVAYLII